MQNKEIKQVYVKKSFYPQMVLADSINTDITYKNVADRLLTYKN